MTEPSDRDLILRLAAELKTMRQLLSDINFARVQAEEEIPESVRRFANYYHDIVNIKGEYHSLGVRCPFYIDQEMERCHDRFRQILQMHHNDGGVFEKVRRSMAEDPENRYDHTRQIAAPKE